LTGRRAGSDGRVATNPISHDAEHLIDPPFGSKGEIMTSVDQPAASGYSRRAFLSLGAAVAGGTVLSACGGGSSSSGAGGKKLKFWDMPWGAAAYNDAAKKLTEDYQPQSGNPDASYQLIQWANFTQTFSAAIASKTGPAVSTGGGFQAFQYADQGAIAYADKLIETFKSDGTYDDFLPGVVEPMKTDKGYAAVPWQLDMRVWWYRKSLLDEAGVKVPTTWAELLTACQALARKGVFGISSGSGAGNNIGAHQMVMMMINNGGGIFNRDGKVELVTDRNIEAMDFVRELINAKAIDPAAVSYTRDNQLAQWKAKKVAMGIDTPGLDGDSGDTSGDLMVMSPLAGPHGDKACLVFQNNIMMYKNTPSQKGSEAFLSYYVKNMKTLWQQKVEPHLPVLKSIIVLPEFQAQKQKVKVIEEWQPVSKTYATLSTKLSPALAQIDGGQPLNQFTQTMLAGKTDSKAALQTLQSALAAIVK
jgi:multiple sugar transport system substrate-binding protein